MKKCSFCGNKNLKQTSTEYTYKLNDQYLLMKNVPCIKCEFCGEKYFEAKVLKQIETEFFNIQNGTKKPEKKITIPTENFKEIA